METVNYLILCFSYSYVYPDPYENYYPAVDGNLFWKAAISPSIMIKMRMWKYIRDAYKSLPTEIYQEKRFLPFEANTIMLKRGESPTTFKGKKVLM